MRPHSTARHLALALCLTALAVPAVDAQAPATPAPAAAVDFQIRPFGPTHVFQRYGMRIGLRARKLSAQGDILALSVADLPPDSECSFKFWDKNRIYHEGDGEISLSTAADTPPGSYVLKISAVAQKSGVTKTALFPIVVDPAPQPLPQTEVTANPSIPLVEKWEEQMLSFGKKLGDADAIAKAGLWEGSVWYYDGERVFYQIADYTGDAEWEMVAQLVEKVYRDDYVLKAKGGVPGWRVFPHGLLEDYRRTGDEQSREAAILLSQRSAYANRAGGVNTELSRETAYCLNAYLVAEELGAPAHPRLQDVVEFALGHLDQWFVSRNFRTWAPQGSMPPFMVGLTCEALIHYYEKSKDARVPVAVKTAMDWLWDNAWIDADESFYYRSDDPYSPASRAQKGAPDLNSLIAPAFAWLYHLTGDPKYRERGDRIFAGGVKGAWLGGGKQFSQSYRWSFDYVQWRRDVPVAGDKKAPVISGVTVERQGNGDVLVKWKSDEPARMQFQCGPTAACDACAAAGRYLVTSWCRRITGLAAGKPYFYRISATDASGNTSPAKAFSF